jgi:3-amino-5-hydroxybenzoate synthase
MSTQSAEGSRFGGRLTKWPVYDEGEEEGVLRVIRSRRWWREAGTEVKQFEKEFADFLRVGHVRATTNGTHAIELALACLGLKAGDEVLVPACTFISTASAVLTYGATPIPVDVDPETLCMDADAAEAAVTPRTRALMPVHMAGQPCDMDRLLELAESHGLDLIEDAAHAHGAAWKGRPAGSMGRCSIFSFQAGKLMTAGEGGALATSDEGVAAETFMRHSCGRPSGDTEYTHLAPAPNLRMSELHAAVLRAQLARLPEQLAVREERAAYLDRLLWDIPGLRPLARRPEVTSHSHYMYMAWFDPEAYQRRSASDIARELRAEGLPAFRCFPPVHQTELFAAPALAARGLPFTRENPPPNYEAMQTPVSAAAGRQVVWLHHSLLLSGTDVLDDVAETLTELQRRPPAPAG